MERKINPQNSSSIWYFFVFELYVALAKRYASMVQTYYKVFEQCKSLSVSLPGDLLGVRSPKAQVENST